MCRFFKIIKAGFQGRLRIRETKNGWHYRTVKDKSKKNNLGNK